MSLLLVTTFPITYVSSFVTQCPFFVSFLYSLFMFIIHYNFGLGSNLIPIYLLSLAGVFLGYFLQMCTTKAKFISRCDWSSRLNLIFTVKLFVLFVICCIYEMYGATPWSIPLLFIGILMLLILAWSSARNECVLVLKTCKKICKYCGNGEYTEKSFRSHIGTPAFWLFISMIVTAILNLTWLLSLVGVSFITPLRVQCFVVAGAMIVLVICAVILNCNKKVTNVNYNHPMSDCDNQTECRN